MNSFRLATTLWLGMNAGPALSIPLADPLMSIIDNVCVGQFAGTTALAALAPAGLIFSLGYIFNALSVAVLRWGGSTMQSGRTLCCASCCGDSPG